MASNSKMGNHTLAAIATMALSGLAVGGSASAGILFDETNITPAGTVPISLTFVATGVTTTLDDEGYQLPGFNQFTDNSLTLTGGGPNLLQQTWTFTPANSGSDTVQYNDTTSVNALDFGGVTQGDYDTYSQTFATTPGKSYTYTFNFVDYAGPENGYIVGINIPAYSGGVTSVPEPSTWLLMIASIGCLGLAVRRAKKESGCTGNELLLAG